MKAVLQAEGLTPTAKNVAAALAVKFFNVDTDQLNPSQETLADFLKVHRDTIKRVLRELRNAGWLLVTGSGGRSHAPNIRLLSPGKIVPFRAEKRGDKLPPEQNKGGANCPRKEGQIIPPHYKEEQTLEQKGPQSSERPSPQCSKVVHHDSQAEVAWNDWLALRGFPPLKEIGWPDSDAQGRGWEMPFRYPPESSDKIQHGIAEKRVWWLINRANARAVRHA
ncbi:MAG: helix-turn-helix domain-containing protein [Rhizobiaceae bacterium]